MTSGSISPTPFSQNANVTRKLCLCVYLFMCLKPSCHIQFRHALCFESNYVGSFMHMETNVITTKMQRNAENA